MSETSNSSNLTCTAEDSGGAQTSRSTTSIHQKSNKSEKLAKEHHGNKENVGNRKTLLAITVEIEDGCSGHIQMKEGDSAEGVATTFCRDYSLPKDFVAPLTEHILNNIINISKKDKNIIFCSSEERAVYEARLEQKTPDNYPDENDSYSEKRSAGKNGGHYQDSGCETPLPQSQNVNKPSCGGVPVLSPKIIMKTRSMLAQRLQCPTHSSSCKTFKPTNNKNRRKRRSSDTAKASCLRLYSDFLTRKKRHLEAWGRNAKSYAEKVDSSKVKGPEKSWRIYRRRSEIAKRYRNYGELLYTEGLCMREKLMKEIERKKRDDAEREMIGFTGRPQITEKAKRMQRDHGNVWHKLAAEKFDIEHMRCEVMEAEMAECTFMPQINPCEDETADPSISRFDQLFFDSESRRRRQRQYSDWYPEGLTFQPAINRRVNDAEEEHGISVFERLSQSNKKLQEKRAMEQDTANCCGVLLDKATGRELFRPKTGRKPQTDRNPKNLQVGAYLHELQAARMHRKEALMDKEENIVRELAKCNYVTPQSQKYLARLKQRAFRQIFEALDTDKDGYIQLCKVDVNRVSYDAACDIKVLVKMGKGNDRLSCDEFHKLMYEVQEKYHQDSTVRGNLRHVNHVDNSNMTFEYKMGVLSSDLAGRRRKYSTRDQWYNIILKDDQKRQQKVDALRKERQRIEMKECTFAPELFTKPGSRNRSRCRPRSAAQVRFPSSPRIVEKVVKEMHGFVFQDDPSCACKEPEDKPEDKPDDKPDDNPDDQGSGSDEFEDQPRRRLPLEEMGPNYLQHLSPNLQSNGQNFASEGECYRPSNPIPSPYQDPRW